jgi:hypothetical protein
MASQSSNGQGSGIAPFLIAPNPGSVPRTGSILIGDQALTINQSAGPSGSVSNYTMSVYAGGGSSSVANLGDGGPATSAYLNEPLGVAFDKVTGNLYIVDSGSARIRVVTPNGNINTFAGGGSSTAENIPALSAELVNPIRVGVDPSSSVYYDDSNSRVRKISGGMVATFAGTTSPGFGGDTGLATSAQLWGPLGIAADSLGNIYIADENNNRIRVVSGGTINTFSGGGSSGLGDNGPSTSAMLSAPSGVAVGTNQVVYIADQDDGRVRKVSQGTITTLASGEDVTDVTIDPAGNVFASIYSYGEIAKITPGGAVSVVTSTSVFSNGLTADKLGNIYFSDEYSGVVMELTPVPVFCGYSVSSPNSVPSAGGTVSIFVTALAGCSWAFYSASSWAVITSGASGTGNGTVQISVPSNSTGPSRTGSIAIAGQVIPLVQEGVASDFNDDGYPDVVWQDPVSGTSMVYYLRGAEGATILGTASIAGANTWHIVAVADFNLDGHPDLVWQDPVTGESQIWFMGVHRARRFWERRCLPPPTPGESWRRGTSTATASRIWCGRIQ